MNEELRKSLISACKWITDIAQVKDNQPVGKRGQKMFFKLWNGAIRGEYRVATKEWDSFGPTWHTGQAVKALTMAASALGMPDLLDAAKYSAEFIMANRIQKGKDVGIILAFEDFEDLVCTSGILETVDGLFMLGDATGDYKYIDAANKAVLWVINKTYVSEKRIFRDRYDYANEVFSQIRVQGRPLLDDAVFLKSWKYTGEEIFRKVAVETADTLLENESPPGNWIKYIPCSAANGRIHPRHAYWWGLPMYDVYLETGDERYLQCFYRSVKWYQRAMRHDGGFIRATYVNFNTDSVNHATSGSACAVICFLKYYEHTGDRKIIPYIEKGLRYCMNMQFTKPEDPNLQGAILEKILGPEGTDRNPFYVRDLGTIFFIQAASMYLQIFSRKKETVQQEKEIVVAV